MRAKRPREGEDGGHRASPLRPVFLVTLLLAGIGIGATAAPAAGESGAESADACLTCHLELDDEVLTPPARLFAKDVHQDNGLTCAACHGGDPHADDGETSMSPKAGFIGVPDALQIPALCAKCHSDEDYIRRFNPALPIDQEAKYRTSGHGKALARGDRNVAQCVSCHGAHGVLRVNDPGSPVYATQLPETCDKCHGDESLMKPYGIGTDPLPDYAASVHGKALLERGDIGAPACNDCHGSHGAAPPGVDAVHFVCGICHLNNREQFQASPHATAFAEIDAPECITCHGFHLVEASDDATLGVGDRGVCRECHNSGDAGYLVGARLGAMVDSLRSGIETAREITDQAEQKGMLVDEPTFQIRAANEHLVKMRTISHAVSPDAMAEDYAAGMAAAEAALVDASDRIEEFHFRRRGLAVASLLNTLLIGLVVVGIRRLARRKESPAG